MGNVSTIAPGYQTRNISNLADRQLSGRTAQALRSPRDDRLEFEVACGG